MADNIFDEIKEISADDADIVVGSLERDDGIIVVVSITAFHTMDEAQEYMDAFESDCDEEEITHH